MKNILIIFCILLLFLYSCKKQEDTILTPSDTTDYCIVNGTKKGTPGNIQDNMFQSLTVDPTNENIVYAGTENSGIFKSIDGGSTWSRLRKGLKCDINKTGYPQIFDIITDKNNTKILYAATITFSGPASPRGNVSDTESGSGIYKSTDGGETWKYVEIGNPHKYTNRIVQDPANSNKLYVAVGGLKVPPDMKYFAGAFVVSEDGGNTWKILSLPMGVESNIFMSLYVSENPKRLFLAASSHGQDAEVAYGFLVSENDGQSWSIRNPPNENGKAVSIAYLDVYKKDPNIVYAVDGINTKVVYKSIDAGKNWTKTSIGNYGPIKISPVNSEVIFSGGIDIIKSSDGGKTNKIVFVNTGGLTQQITDIEISASNPNVIYACSKGYRIFKSTDGGESFKEIVNLNTLF